MTDKNEVFRPQKKNRKLLLLVGASVLVSPMISDGGTGHVIGASRAAAAEMPANMPSEAAKALRFARTWKPDAALVAISIEQNLDYAPTFSFLSPSDGSRLDISDQNGAMTPHPTAPGVNGFSTALPQSFTDLPEAIKTGRTQGMPATVKMAMLDVESVANTPPAPVWTLQVETNAPPYVYYVDAVTNKGADQRHLVGSSPSQQSSAPAHSSLMAWMTNSRNPSDKGQVTQGSSQGVALWERGNSLFDRNDYHGAFPLYVEAAKDGNPRAMATLGNMYRDGLGVPKDSKRALEWYKQAAELGNRGAQYSLGSMYEEGEGTEINLTEAARLYEQSARQGMPEAQFALGLSYEFGEGVPRNRQTAIYWLDQAGAQGDGRAKWHADWLSRPDTPQFKDEAAFGQYISGKVSAHVWKQMSAGNSAHVSGSPEPEYNRGEKASLMDIQGDHAGAQRCASGGPC